VPAAARGPRLVIKLTHMRRVILIALATCAVALPATAGTTSTGLRGLVTRGPITPVCRVDTPCTAPAKHTTIVFIRNGVSKSAVTGDTGRYSILLAAGTYAVRIPAGARFGFKPRTVYVTAGRMSTRNFSIDTGIR
jgi:hypothetical protein